MALSPGGERVISGSWDRTVRVWSLEDKKCVATLEVGFGVLVGCGMLACGLEVFEVGFGEFGGTWTSSR